MWQDNIEGLYAFFFFLNNPILALHSLQSFKQAQIGKGIVVEVSFCCYWSKKLPFAFKTCFKIRSKQGLLCSAATPSLQSA